MTVVETALIFAGIPLGVILLTAIAVYGRSAVHQPNRYRPGKPWRYQPVWYLPHPEALDVIDGPGPGRAAIESGSSRAIEGAAGATETGAMAVGGASGEW